MYDALIHLGVFSAELTILFIFIVMVLIVIFLFFAIVAKSKRGKGKLVIRNYNVKLEEEVETILAETLSHKEFKKFLKKKRAEDKSKQKKSKNTIKNIFILTFHGDLKASAVDVLREEVTAILAVAQPNDEVVMRLESAGGLVHTYGLGAAQLMRLRQHKVPLTVLIDKVAASGGYLMACIANKIYSAPFAIIGSIGVIVQLPNFHRLLKEKHIDFEQYTAGEFKRTITIFGKNTEEGRRKLKEEIEDVHQLFKNIIGEHRPQVDLDKVATGEHWLGLQSIALKLVDEIKTSDEYLLERSKAAHLYEVYYEVKKPFMSRFHMAMQAIRGVWLRPNMDNPTRFL